MTNAQSSQMDWRKAFFVKKLLPLIPYHRAYVEPFGGAASLLFAKEPSPIEVYNDRNGDLANLFFVLRSRPFQFIRRVGELPYSRQVYRTFWTDLRDRFPRFNDLDRAVKFFHAMRSCFPRGIGAGWAFGRDRSHARTYRNAVARLEACAERLKDVCIDSLDFRNCVRNWDSPDTFFFVDPPYWGCEDYYGKFDWQDHIDLARILRGAAGKWLLTIGDNKEIGRLYGRYKPFRVRSPIAAEKVKGQPRRHLTNLIVMNYELPQTSARHR